MLENRTVTLSHESTVEPVEEILTFLDLLHPEGDEFPVAICCLPVDGKMFGRLFTTHRAAAEYAAQQDESGRFKGIYTNLNRLRLSARPDSVPDKKDDISCYTNLLIDLDRRTDDDGGNASEEELAEVASLRDLLRGAVTDEVSASFLETFSGNGYAFIPRLRDHPVDGQDAVRRLLERLAQRFGTANAKLDASVHNPARLTRLCGTWNRKYPETGGRPHRRARLLSLAEPRLQVYTFPPPEAPTETVSAERPHGLPLRTGVDFRAELEKAGLEFTIARRDGNTCYDYHNLNGNGRECLAGGRLHTNNLHNPRCSTFIETPDHTVYHSCFSGNCDKHGQTRRALRALKLEHVLVPQEFKFTDLGNAERLYAEHGDNLRYAHDRCSWFYYDGTRWALDQTGEVHRRAAKTIRDMQVAALNESNDDYRQKLLKWGIKCESNAMLNNMVSRAEKLEGFTALSSNFDKDPFSFNVQNGTIDLRTGDLRPHDRADFISKLAPVVYDPTAECPRWRQFLREILPDTIATFLQTAVGYTLSGDTRQKYLFMMIGEAGDNGKTTFIEALRKLFGDYAVNMNFNSLLPREDNGPSGDIARLVGARFASASESGEGQRLSMPMLKRLVGGGDTLTARRLYENEIEFEPTHKIWLATNYQPVVPARDNAAWNRVLKIPFETSIPKDKQDKTLPDVFMGELSGILNWALEGSRRFWRDGLAIPSEITSATAEYRDSQDKVKEWLTESTEKSFNNTLGSRLYDDFTKHCQDTSGRGKATNVMSNTMFYKELRRLGYESKHERDGTVILGIGFRIAADM